MGIFREKAGLALYRARFPQRLSTIHVAIVILVTLLFIISGSYHDDVTTYLKKTPGISGHGLPGFRGPRIPNIIHFTQISSDPESPFTFDFRQCMSIYSAWYYNKPDTIFIHTNATNAQIEDARRGKTGKWAKLILGLPNMKVNQAVMRTEAGNGVHIDWLAHTSDFLRVEMVSNMILTDGRIHAFRKIVRALLTGRFSIPRPRNTAVLTSTSMYSHSRTSSPSERATLA